MSERISTTSHEITEMRSPSEDELLKMRYRDLARMFRGLGGNIVNTKKGIVAVDSTGNPIKKGAMIDHILSHQPSEDGNVIDNGSTLGHESLTMPMQLTEIHKQATIVNELRGQLARLRSSGVPTLEQSMEMNELQHLIEIGEDKIADGLIQYRNGLDDIQDPNMRQVAIQSYNDAEAFIINATEGYLDSPASEPDSQPASQEPNPTGNQVKEPATPQPASQEPDPTGNQGQGKQPVGGSGTKEPVTARGVAKRLRAEGKEFSLEEYKKALAGEEEDSLQVDKGLWTKLANIFRRKSHEEGDEKSWLDKMREKKIGRKVTAIVALGAAVLGVGVASGNSAEANNIQTVAAAKAFRNGDTPLDLSTAADRTDSNLDLAEGQEVGGSNEIDNEEIRGYRPELDPFFDEGKTAEYNMSNGFRTDVSPKEAMGLWQEDWENSPEMMSMIAAELGMEGSENPTSLDDLLTNSPDYYESWADKIEAMLGRATDVHYETLPAGTVYNTWYTALDENGDPQLVQSEGISHDHDVTLLVMDVQVNGQEVTLKINSECGQGISAQMYDNVPVFIPYTGTPDQPVIPGDNTPPTPTTPGEGTPPPTTPGEDTPPTPTTPPENPGGETPGDESKPNNSKAYKQPGDGSETDSGEGEKPLSEAESEAQNPAEVQQETSEGDSSSNQPGSETNIDAAGTNDNTVDVSGSVEGAGDGQTNTGTVAGPQ